MSGSLLPTVLYEDDDLIAFDKPSGLLVAPDRWDKELENLMGLVHQHLSPDWFNVHRLDRETSGVLLCAKNKAALDALSLAFERKTVRKEYLAITRGLPPLPRGCIDVPIAPSQDHPGLMRIARRGKPAVTDYELVEGWRDFAVVKLLPQTGRTHQLRVHMAHAGCPILCDPIYGSPRPLFLSDLKRNYKPTRDEERPMMGRLALHAGSLTVEHPSTHQPLTMASPLPKEFEISIKYLRRFARRG
ncbi:MAG TPA: RluA family pseudouridine synthase [Kiritimatiellia bacterium]|nr:RluA family pseudouridine synthase [Kiritimatiellia bacterium]